MQHTRHTPGFAIIGARMIWEWQKGLLRLQERLPEERQAAMPSFTTQALQAGVSEPPKPERFAPERSGESPLLGRRRSRPLRPAA